MIYNRISPPIASLAMVRQGTPQCFIDMMFKTIDNMNHHIRTTYGDSIMSYNSENTKLHGILQGNGAGPTIWTMVNSLRAEGCGAVRTHPLTKQTTIVPRFCICG
jgi:hypothetical protein